MDTVPGAMRLAVESKHGTCSYTVKQHSMSSPQPKPPCIQPPPQKSLDPLPSVRVTALQNALFRVQPTPRNAKSKCIPAQLQQRKGGHISLLARVQLFRTGEGKRACRSPIMVLLPESQTCHKTCFLHQLTPNKNPG